MDANRVDDHRCPRESKYNTALCVDAVIYEPNGKMSVCSCPCHDALDSDLEWAW